MVDRSTRRAWLARGTLLAGSALAGKLGRVLATPAAGSLADAPSLPVAIGRCDGYAPRALFECLQQAIDRVGGVGRLVTGKTVTIKLNLTGGPKWKLGGLPAHRTYHVHPNFVAATCAVLSRAGAKKIVLVESGYDRKPLDAVMAAAGWNIDGINAAGEGKVVWEDTRHQGPWSGYSRLAVPWGGYVYPAFDLNRRYEKTDVFMSLAKLKDHANAGITASVKNLFGIAPTSIYGDNYDGAGRPAVDERSLTARGTTFHRGERSVPAGVPREVDRTSSRHWRHRVPRITAALFAVRPVDLCLVAGVETNRGGEGPGVKGVEPIRPGLLLAGRNGVCTDAICTAAMGYDPTADHDTFPFPGDNHLTLLAEQGIGTNDVDQIEVVGIPLSEAVHPFNPHRRKIGQPIFS